MGVSKAHFASSLHPYLSLYLGVVCPAVWPWPEPVAERGWEDRFIRQWLGRLVDLMTVLIFGGVMGGLYICLWTDKHWG